MTHPTRLPAWRRTSKRCRTNHPATPRARLRHTTPEILRKGRKRPLWRYRGQAKRRHGIRIHIERAPRRPHPRHHTENKNRRRAPPHRNQTPRPTKQRVPLPEGKRILENLQRQKLNQPRKRAETTPSYRESPLPAPKPPCWR